VCVCVSSAIGITRGSTGTLSTVGNRTGGSVFLHVLMRACVCVWMCAHVCELCVHMHMCVCVSSAIGITRGSTGTLSAAGNRTGGSVFLHVLTRACVCVCMCAHVCDCVCAHAHVCVSSAIGITRGNTGTLSAAGNRTGGSVFLHVLTRACVQVHMCVCVCLCVCSKCACLCVRALMCELCALCALMCVCVRLCVCALLCVLMCLCLYVCVHVVCVLVRVRACVHRSLLVTESGDVLSCVLLLCLLSQCHAVVCGVVGEGTGGLNY